MHGPDSGSISRTWLRGVDDAKFRKQVVPGDRLQLEVTLGASRSAIARARALARDRRRDRGGSPLADGAGTGPPWAVRATADIHPTAIVHRAPRSARERSSGRSRRSASTSGSGATAGSARPRHRRVDRDRRRQRDLSDGLRRARPAGLEVRRRAHPPGDRGAQRDPRVRDDSSRHGRRRRRDDDRVDATC